MFKCGPGPGCDHLVPRVPMVEAGDQARDRSNLVQEGEKVQEVSRRHHVKPGQVPADDLCPDTSYPCPQGPREEEDPVGLTELVEKEKTSMDGPLGPEDVPGEDVVGPKKVPKLAMDQA